jgi:osmoprotectant transport system ATP-binding protein
VLYAGGSSPSRTLMSEVNLKQPGQFSAVAANPQSAVIEFRNVHLTINGHSLIAGLDLAVTRGERLVLLGRSGSGKTTTLKLINRLHEPSAGEVLVEGRATTDWDPIRLRRSIGYVIQEVGLLPHFTVERNVALVPTIEGWQRQRIHDRVQELLRLVGLDATLARRYPAELSGGQRQRVGVARALAADPAILLMDEPFGALDPITRCELQQEFRDLQEKLAKTVVFVTHDLSEALFLGSRIGLFEAGRLTGIYTPDEFMCCDDHAVAAYRAAFRAVAPAGSK